MSKDWAVPVHSLIKDDFDSETLSLANFYLMGQLPNEAVTMQPKPEILQETRLYFKLRGIFNSEGPMLGGAVIDTGTEGPGFFQVGDLIAENVTLAAINGRTIVIDRNGQREKLSFDQSIIEFDTFSRPRNKSYIVSMVKQDKPIIRQPSLEDRLAKLRSKYRQNN